MSLRNTHTHDASGDTRQALDQFKYEVARDIGVNIPTDHYWGDISARQCGAVGGNMVRQMIEMAENTLVNRSGSGRKR